MLRQILESRQCGVLGSTRRLLSAADSRAWTWAIPSIPLHHDLHFKVNSTRKAGEARSKPGAAPYSFGQIHAARPKDYDDQMNFV